MDFQPGRLPDFAAKLSLRKSFLHSTLQRNQGVGMPIPY